MTGETKVVFGLTGLKGAGKGTVAREITSRLQAAGRSCRSYVISEAIRRFMATQNVPSPSVEQLQNTANALREANGGGYWAERLAGAIEEDGSGDVAIIDGLRNPEEIRVLRERFGDRLYLAAVTAPTLIRWARFRQRSLTAEGRPNDPKTLEEFLALDDRDRGIGEPSWGQQVDGTIALVPSERVLNNAGELSDLQRWAEGFLSQVLH